MTKVRIEKTKDFHETMSSWLKLHGWPPLQLEALPDIIFVLNNGFEDCYCCSLYITDSDFGFVAWPVSNKRIKRTEGDLNILFEEIEKYAKSKGVSILFTTSNTPVIESSLGSLGWGLGDTNVNQYIKRI